MPILMPMMGMAHSLEVGAKRFVDGLNNDNYKTGKFYASKSNKPTGAVSDQNIHFPDLDNTTYQDNAYEAIHRFTA